MTLMLLKLLAYTLYEAMCPIAQAVNTLVVWAYLWLKELMFRFEWKVRLSVQSDHKLSVSWKNKPGLE